MMFLKKILPITISLLCIFYSVPCVASDSATAPHETYTIVDKYAYSVTLFDEEWKLLTESDHREICKIPESYYSNATTEALLISIIENPYTVTIFAFDSVSLGIDILKLSICAIDVLLQRNDFFVTVETYISDCESASGRLDSIERIYYLEAVALKDYYLALYVP